MADIICAIDVGTTKVTTIIAEVIDADTLHVLGFGSAPSDGMTKGVVTNVAAVAAARPSKRLNMPRIDLSVAPMSALPAATSMRSPAAALCPSVATAW